jgi:hypothetical protein
MELLNDMKFNESLSKTQLKERIGNTHFKFVKDIGLIIRERSYFKLNDELLREGILYGLYVRIVIDSMGNKEIREKQTMLYGKKLETKTYRERKPLFYPLTLDESIKRFGNKWSYAGVFVPYAYTLSIKVDLPFTPKEIKVFKSEAISEDLRPVDPIPIRDPKVSNPRSFCYNFRMVRRGGYFIGWIPPS